MDRFDVDPRLIQRGEPVEVRVPRSGELIVVHTTSTGFYVFNQEHMKNTKYMGEYALNITGLGGVPIARIGELENGRVFYRKPDNPGKLGNRLFQISEGQKIFVGLDAHEIGSVSDEEALLWVSSPGRVSSFKVAEIDPRRALERLKVAAAVKARTLITF